MALSMDLRKRLIECYENKEGTIQSLAKRFKVGESSIWRLLKQKQTLGNLSPKTSPGRPRKIDEQGQKLLEQALSKNEDLTLMELVRLYKKHCGISVCVATLHNTLCRIKINYKKNIISQRTIRSSCRRKA